MNLIKDKRATNVQVLNHPLAQHKLTLLRDKDTSKKKFNELVCELSLMLAYETTSSLPIENKTIETPLTKMDGIQIAGKKPLIIPILRAGLGMVDGFLQLMPGARVGHIGLYRDEETHEPKKYYFKIPSNQQERTCYLIDPMLATGGSASAAITMLKAEGIKNILFVCLVSAPEGALRLLNDHPDVPIYTVSLDEKLNENAYIIPGLGDAGDRIFGTK